MNVFHAGPVQRNWSVSLLLLFFLSLCFFPKYFIWFLHPDILMPTSISSFCFLISFLWHPVFLVCAPPPTPLKKSPSIHFLPLIQVWVKRLKFKQSSHPPPHPQPSSKAHLGGYRGFPKPDERLLRFSWVGTKVSIWGTCPTQLS